MRVFDPTEPEVLIFIRSENKAKRQTYFHGNEHGAIADYYFGDDDAPTADALDTVALDQWREAQFA